MSLQNACVGKIAPPQHQGLAVGSLMGCLSIAQVSMLLSSCVYRSDERTLTTITMQCSHWYTHQRADTRPFGLPRLVDVDGCDADRGRNRGWIFAVHNEPEVDGGVLGGV